MSPAPRRRLLRDATAEAHAALESAVGPLDTLEHYRLFLQGMYAFRRPLEDAIIAREAIWRLDDYAPLLVATDLRHDLEDLGVGDDLGPDHEAGRAEAQNPAMSFDIDEWVGAFYVVEGSGLGARVLINQVRRLGLHGAFGARHLQRQVDGSEHWRRFQRMLERRAPLDLSKTICGARTTFAAAHAAIIEVRRHVER